MKKSFFSAKFLVVLTFVFAIVLVDSAVAVVDLEAQSIRNANRPPDGIFHPDQQNFQIGYSVFNGGDETSDDYTIEVYIGDYLVGSKTNGGLGPQRDRHGLILFPFPTDISLGTHTLRMKILCPNDDTPNNNEVSGEEVTVAERGPADLWFSYFYVPGNLFYGTDSVTLNCRVENIGHSHSGNYTLDFYIDGYNLGSEIRNSIAGHGRDGFSFTISLPYDYPEGTHLITAELTCSDDSDPGNNSAQGSIRVGKSVHGSISIESVDAAGDVYLPGEPIVVRIDIDGVGGHLDTSFEVDVYASADLDITTSDYKIHSYDSETISPGESRILFEECQLPSDIPVGYYYMGIILTYSTEDGTESERVFDNSIVYIGGYSDVVVQSVGITPGGYLPGEDFIVYSLIMNVGEWATGGYTVDYYASTDAVITTDDYHIGYVDRNGLAPGEQHSYETTNWFPFNIAAGNYYIGAIVTCPRGSDFPNNTGCSEETIELVHPAGYVCGQMLYQDREWRQEHPIRYALVEVYDADDNEDPLDDRVIGKTHTDHNGNYGVAVLNDETSSQNIYVKVFTESAGGAYPETTGKACSVKDDVFEEIYYLKSDFFTHPQDLSVVINMTALDDGGEFMVYDSVIEGFHKAKTFFDVNLPEVTTFWPCEEETSYFDPCDRSMYIAQGDRGDRDVIMHEYGHFIADVFAFGQGPVGENSLHYWNADLRDNPIQRSDEEARNLGFRESWASIFSIATQYGDNWYYCSGDTEYQDLDEESEKTFTIDLEKDTDDRYQPGEYYENMTCCALWDIFDDNDDRVDDDDTLSDITLSKIWSIARDFQPDDIIDFWNSWFQSYDYTSEITRIFQDHKMSFVKPNIPFFPSDQNNPPIADAGRDRIFLQTCAEGAYVHLNGFGSWDPDGDTMTYEWRLNDIIIATGVSPTLFYMLPGTTIFTLAVTDGQEYDYDSVKITVIPTDPSTWD